MPERAVWLNGKRRINVIKRIYTNDVTSLSEFIYIFFSFIRLFLFEFFTAPHTAYVLRYEYKHSLDGNLFQLERPHSYACNGACEIDYF